MRTRSVRNSRSVIKRIALVKMKILLKFTNKQDHSKEQDEQLSSLRSQVNSLHFSSPLPSQTSLPDVDIEVFSNISVAPTYKTYIIDVCMVDVCQLVSSTGWLISSAIIYHLMNLYKT